MTIKIQGTPPQGQMADNLYAVIAIDPNGNEGICGAEAGSGVMIPMVGCNLDIIGRVAEKYVPILTESSPGFRFEIRKYSLVSTIRKYDAKTN